MKQVDTFWTILDHFGPFWKFFRPFQVICTHVNPFGPNWTKLDPLRHLWPIWTYLDPFGTIWTNLNQFGPNWTHVDQFGPISKKHVTRPNKYKSLLFMIWIEVEVNLVYKEIWCRHFTFRDHHLQLILSFRWWPQEIIVT